MKLTRKPDVSGSREGAAPFKKKLNEWAGFDDTGQDLFADENDMFQLLYFYADHDVQTAFALVAQIGPYVGSAPRLHMVRMFVIMDQIALSVDQEVTL